MIERKSVIWALINREITARFGKSYFGYAWIFIDPTIQIAFFVVLFTFLRLLDINGMSIYVFLLTGVLPFSYISKSLTSNVKIIESIQAMLNYQPVKPIDAIIAKQFVDTVINIILFITGLIILTYIGDKYTIHYPLRIIIMFAILIINLFGLGLILAILGYYYIDLAFIIGILVRVLYFISNVIIPIDTFPVQLRHYLEYNPFLQIIEFIRSAFSAGSLPSYLSYTYVINVTIMSLIIGISLYFISRKNIIMNARAR